MTKIKLYLIFLFLCSLVTQAQTTAWDGNPADKIVNAGGGIGEEGSPIEIASASELAYLAQQTNSGGKELTLEKGESIKDKTNFTGVYFKLTEDIDLEGQAWTPIGKNNSNPFKGVLDGDNHKILNLASINTDDYNYAGLFGIIKNATIQNLHIKIIPTGLHVQGVNSNVGVLAGYVTDDSKIVNCSIEGGDITVDAPNFSQLNVGGLTGHLRSSSITDCSSNINVRLGGSSVFSVGGIIGVIGNAVIEKCKFKGSITTVDENTNIDYTGGITGASDLNTIGPNAPRESKISECTANVNITAGTHAGGIVGYFYKGFVEKCSAKGNISTKETKGKAGGIIGENFAGGTVTDCYNTASITSSHSAGGIVGYKYSNATLSIKKCWSSNDITASRAGGIIGQFGFGSIEECYTSGKIIGKDPTGGVAGGISAYTVFISIKDCSSEANVTTDSDISIQAYAGGIVGLGLTNGKEQITSIQNCYSTGKLSSNYAAGGIAGLNQDGSISNCIALNIDGIGAITKDEDETAPTMKASDEIHFGRIAGIESGTLTSNFASPLIPGNWENDHAGKDGDDLTSDNFTHGDGKAFHQWDKENIWSFDPDGIHLPILKVFGENTGDDKPVQPKIPKSNFLAFTLTYDKSLSNGTITVTSSGNPILSGTSIAGGTVLTITVTPNEGYDLVGLTVNNKEFTSGDTYTVDGDVEIKAEFSILSFTINYDEPSKGTIRVTYSDNGSETVVPSRTSLDYGTEITIEAIPESGYRIESLKVNEETFSSGSSLLLTENIFIEATFGKIPDPVPDYPDYPIYTYYTIKLPKVEGATTNPSAGTYIYREGSDFSFTLTLDSAYNQSEPIVKLSDSTILEPDRWGYYTIWDIDRDWKICITEIKLNPDPVANETIKSGIDIKVLEDGLHIRLSQPGRIQIITPGGQILRRLQLPAGDNHIFSLPKGIYLIRQEGGKTVKVSI